MIMRTMMKTVVFGEQATKTAVQFRLPSKLLDCSFYLTGTKAAGANIHRLGCTADDSLNSSDVSLERSVFLAVRVRNGATERNALSAYTALCHVTDTSCELRLS